MRNFAWLVVPVLFISVSASAEQGCPPGQIPAQSNGSAASCGPIPSGYYQEQPTPAPRPPGKWIKTWGAIAGDGNDNLGVSTGKIKRSEAQQDALAKCSESSQKECRILYIYENRCAAISEPDHAGHIVRGFAAGPSVEVASKNALAVCNSENPNSECKVIYKACTEPVFQRF
ncbi:DUF4189 domain-containing protein [Xanthomonas graminis]|uniref:DUF4189 domain-containing protein n=1 Tax=Xanthomonas graminis TaxID=3390026 RepID=UPI0009BF5118|nr:DUF4189 domain-containing protein [Xanthomonas translucens]UKE79175.1 DUF4189 domain-containing protein [Xanthomonas translucens pv. arrhenatheri]